MFHTHWICLFLALQKVSGWCILLYFKPDNNTCSCLFRKWVAAMPCCIWTPLISPALGSAACEYLLSLVVYQVCWQCLFLALQSVSCSHSLLDFKPTNNTCLWLSREWVTDVSDYISRLLTVLILCSSESEWLPCFLCFQLTDDTYPWPFSLWVLVEPYCTLKLVTMPVLGFPESEWLLSLAVVFQAC